MEATNSIPLVESTLISLISLGTKVSQWIGYFPLSILKTKSTQKFVFCWCSFPIFCTLGLVCFQTFLVIEWYYFRNDVLSMTRLVRSTEVLAFNISGILLVFQTFSKRLFNILSPKLGLDRWTAFVQNVAQISSSHPNFLISIDPSSKHCKIFIRVKNSVKHTVHSSLFLIFLLISQFLLAYYTMEDERGADPTKPRSLLSPEQQIIGMLSLLSWNILGAFNVFQTLWVTYPIQVVNAFLEVINAELCEFSQDHDTRGVLVHPKRILINENVIDVCIQNYHRIIKILRSYNELSASIILFEIVYNSLLILLYLFIGFTWGACGEIGAGISRIIPILLCLKIIYHLGTEAGNLEIHQRKILRSVCHIPQHDLSDGVKGRLATWLQELSGDALRVEPGLYFTLNRRLLTSVSRIISMSRNLVKKITDA